MSKLNFCPYKIWMGRVKPSIYSGNEPLRAEFAHYTEEAGKLRRNSTRNADHRQWFGVVAEEHGTTLTNPPKTLPAYPQKPATRHG